MAKAITISMLILIVLNLLGIASGGNLGSYTMNSAISNSAIVNGSVYTYEISGGDVVLFIDPVAGAWTILTLTLILIIGLSMNVLGSGMQNYGIKMVGLVTIYGSGWGILSILPFGMLYAIPYFGGTFYLFLTVAYAYGVFNQLSN